MSLWIVAIVLILLLGAIGFFCGAVRMTVWFVGLLLGLAVSIPLGPAIRGLVSLVGVKNPIWLDVIPPVVVFALFNLVFFGLSFLVHHKLKQKFLFTRDDVFRIRFDRFNRHVGAFTGVVMATVFFFTLSSAAYVFGYLAVQITHFEGGSSGSLAALGKVTRVATPKKGKGLVRLVFLLLGNSDPAKLRLDLASTKMDRAAGALAPKVGRFYDIADTLGLLYHNRELKERMLRYPPLIPMAHRDDIVELMADEEYVNFAMGGGEFMELIDHPRTQQIYTNGELLETLSKLDLKDFQTYLRTGKSPKYSENELLGEWMLDKEALITYLRKTLPDIKPRQLISLKHALSVMPRTTLSASPDNRVFFKVHVPVEAAPQVDENGFPITPESAPPPEDPYARYRNAPPTAQPAPVAPPPRSEGPGGLRIPQLSGEGTWSESFGTYEMVFNDPSGKPVKASARIKDGELIVSANGQSLVFLKEE